MGEKIIDFQPQWQMSYWEAWKISKFRLDDDAVPAHNQWYREYMRWYATRYRPADRKAEPWNGYYFTAYGIAVKHGFQGTEEQWLEHLGMASSVDQEMKRLIVISDTKPRGPALWLDNSGEG